MSHAHLLVLECGPATGLQDGGRLGYQRQGLSGSGPMDRLALAAANALVGNAPGLAAVELALSGARLRAVGGAVRLALAGAPFGLSIDGETLGDHHSLCLPEGATLALTPPRQGLFAYLAVAGGIDVPDSLGSRALHLRAALGGIDGRALRAGDRLPVAASADALPDRALDPLPLDAEEPVRVVLGPQADHFPDDAVASFLAAPYTVSNRADRMGYQLDGPPVRHGDRGFNIVSDATVAGSVQVPGSGLPIILMADRQTTGGYPKIATVISADLRRVAQRRPGERLRFAPVTVDHAVGLAREAAALKAGLPGQLRSVVSRDERLMAANLAGNAVDALAP
ncbi:biotin-dependent carboxyltransferase family protein [Methylobacterium durans]|uniref:5-oxoprolinase subunit C family protein n=1 Tax=Methylobacterium durans TaxID=2202825 RepID=UPI002AFEAA45|nr:biotin-dependent carboxyltransferase family protein [Methylobacterium durans]MEA1830551.1 biotin-dependent carboxyltransferase family protein [Methylobacterium durans]